MQCSTCLELLAPGDDLTSTPCGHVFHVTCVVQWFETKKNCPQCRHPARESTLRRIFLAETDGDTTLGIDSSSLQSDLDDAKLQVRMKDNELRKTIGKVKEMEEQSAKQREEIKSLERARNKLKEQYEGVRSQAKLLQGEKIRCDEALREAELLRAKLENFKTVEVALKGQEGALNQFLHDRGAFDGRTKDLASLVILLKQKLAEVKQERSKTEAQLKTAELTRGRDRQRVKLLETQVGDIQAVARNLEGDLLKANKETSQLREQLKKSLRSTQSELNSDKSDKPLESPHGQLQALEEMLDLEDEEWEKPSKLPSFTPAGLNIQKEKKKEEREESPVLSSSNILTNRPTNSMLKTREVGGGLSRQYDGMGGRSRQLFESSSSSSANKLKALAGPSHSQAKKKKTVPMTQKPNKQMKTLDKFFGSFDTP